MRIVVDRTRCTGIGICEALAEDHFEVGDDGELSVTGSESVADEALGRVKAAVKGCPARALRLEDE